jgi:hypothetical protein
MAYAIQLPNGDGDDDDDYVLREPTSDTVEMVSGYYYCVPRASF